MAINIQKASSNYRIQKSSTLIISYIGIAFIAIAGLNSIFEVPAEFIIGVSFAAFFFVLADFTVLSGTDKKPANAKIYNNFLFLAVLSFILLPIFLPFFPDVYKLMASSSESLSIASLGFVLVMINFRMWAAEEEFFDEIKKTNAMSKDLIMDYQSKLQNSIKQTDKSVEMADRASALAQESNEMAKRTLEMNEKLIKLIEEGETLEEIREKVKSY